MIRNYCKSFISEILEIIVSIKSSLIFNNIQTKTQSLVSKLKLFNSSSAKILQKILLSILLLLVVSSCGKVCADADDFGSETIFIDASREGQVRGDYETGQMAFAQDTGLITNGEPLIIKVTGAWSAWGELSGDNNIHSARACELCIKKLRGSNCLCNRNEDPEEAPQEEPQEQQFNLIGEPNPDNFTNSEGVQVEHNCDDPEQQEDPNFCSCSKIGSINDLDTYLTSKNHMYVDETSMTPNEQSVCKFTAGAGLYIGLYGPDGLSTPKRLYHMYVSNPENTGCDVPRTNGECLDFLGNDITHYIFKSSNSKNLMRTDNAGDDGTDTDGSNDEYHQAGERVKLNIFDDFYYDNSGGYKIEFLSGVIQDKDTGLIENLVRTVEDVLLGKFSGQKEAAERRGFANANLLFAEFNAQEAVGPREGGILELMYNTIIRDSTFQTIVQIVLILYVTFFGMGILMGSVEIANKEISSRVIKIALISLFVGLGGYNGWAVYNDIIVGFFKYGLDNIITMFSSIVDSGTSEAISISQGNRSVSDSQATRFSYVDNTLKMLISAPVHRKIWSLLFSPISGLPFGIVLIPLIYFMLFFFFYTVITAAVIYVSSLLKMVVVLALGPLFLLASLFTQTEEMFKKWVAFIAARSLEILALFLILYLFIDIIDFRIKELLYFDCLAGGSKTGPIVFGIWRIDQDGVNGSRPILEWMNLIFSLLAIIFLLKVIIDQITDLMSDLVSISGVQTPLIGDAFTSNVMAAFKQGAVATVRRAKTLVIRDAGNLITSAGRESGLSRTAIGIRRKYPIQGRESKEIDNIIKEATKQAKADGNKGKSLDMEVRKRTMEEMAKRASKSGKVLKTELVKDGLKKALVEKPMRKYVKERSKQLANDPNVSPYGNEMVEKLRDDVAKWSKENLGLDEQESLEQLNKLRASNWWRPTFTQTQGSALKKATAGPQKMAQILSADKKTLGGYIKGKMQGQVSGRHELYAHDEKARTEAQKGYIDRLALLPKVQIRKPSSKIGKARHSNNAQFKKDDINLKLNKFVGNLDEASRVKMEKYLASGTEEGGRFHKDQIDSQVKMIQGELRSDLADTRKHDGTARSRQRLEALAQGRLELLAEQIQAKVKEEQLGKKRHKKLLEDIRLGKEKIDELKNQENLDKVAERELLDSKNHLKDIEEYQQRLGDEAEAQKALEKVAYDELTQSLKEAQKALEIEEAEKIAAKEQEALEAEEGGEMGLQGGVEEDDADEKAKAKQDEDEQVAQNVDTSQLTAFEGERNLASYNKTKAKAELLKLQLELMTAKLDQSPKGLSKVKELEGKVSDAQGKLTAANKSWDEAQNNVDLEKDRVRDLEALNKS